MGEGHEMSSNSEEENPNEQTMSREELIAKLNASAERTLSSLQKAYEAGLKEGMSDEEEDRLIELMRRAKDLKDKVLRITSEFPSA